MSRPLKSGDSLQDVDPAWAWAAFEPGPSQPWRLELAAHLLRRAGFGGTFEQLSAAVDRGPKETLQRLLTGGEASEAFYREADTVIRPLLASGNLEHLPAWWLHTMLHSPHPLKEKLTLFWHGHFATSAAKVMDVDLMYRQHTLLRKHALSEFGPLLVEAAKDPAMLLWLDSTTNHKARPNENFAREVMELFCLGLGNYSERDIKEAARAFTGWELRNKRFFLNRAQHDTGQKTVLGRSGDFDGEQVLAILLEQPAAARFLVGKLFRYFVSETADPPEALLEPLAREYRQRQYDTGWLVATMLGSNLFYSPLALRQRIKSPVELVIGLLRTVDGAANMYVLAEELRNLGQGVFYPPNVKGWDGGVEWINSASLLARANLLWALIGGSSGRLNSKVPLSEVASQAERPGAAANVQWWADLLLGSPLPEAVQVQLTAVAAEASGDQRLRLARLVHGMVTLPEFQLA